MFYSGYEFVLNDLTCKLDVWYTVVAPRYLGQVSRSMMGRSRSRPLGVKNGGSRSSTFTFCKHYLDKGFKIEQSMRVHWSTVNERRPATELAKRRL